MMNDRKYRIRLVLEQNHADQAGYLSLWVPIQERILFDPAPDLDAARQAFDDTLATLDAKNRSDSLRESDY